MTKLDIKHVVHPNDYKAYDTQTLRERFVFEGLFVPGQVNWGYCGAERLLLAGVCPEQAGLTLVVPEELGPEPLTERRELGIVNLGEPGEVRVGSETYPMAHHDGLYIGRGSDEVELLGQGAKFYVACAPAHQTYPTKHIAVAEAEPMKLGDQSTSNARTIYQYIAPGIAQSCQLMMGITKLEPGSVWNTMPCHLHLRRMEVYLYCDLPDDQLAVHLMGQPSETRNLMMRNGQAVVSPSWSIHCAAGTTNYSFLWCMIGENQSYTDMAPVATSDLL